MRKFFLKQIILILSKTSIMVGGQAVLNGVMMRVPGYYATAVRNPHREIVVNRQKHQSLVEQYSFNNILILRGFLHLIDSMKIGFKTLDWSAKISEEGQKSNKILDFLMTIFSIFFAISLFMGIPYLLTNYGLNNFFNNLNNDFIFNTVAGLLRILIFLLYLYFISRIQEVKQLFQYHGAEHKVVYNFESGKKINCNNSQKFSTKHPRCGTSFLFILMLITIIAYSFADSFMSYYNLISFNFFSRIIFHLSLLPLVAGLGYETLKFLAPRQNNYFVKLLSLPGLMLQNITTQEPDDSQIEVSIAALEAAFGDTLRNYQGKQYLADAVG